MFIYLCFVGLIVLLKILISGTKDLVGVCFVAAIVSLIPLFALIGVSRELDCCQSENKDIYYKVDIVSLRGDSSISSSFFLGCGNINGVEYYRCFQKNKDESFQRVDIRTSNAVIFESNEISPRIEWIERFRRKMWIFRIGIEEADTVQRMNGKYKIIVPDGTIIQNFNAR